MRQEDVARARMWQVLTTDLRDLFGTRATDEVAPAAPVPAQRSSCSACHGTGVVVLQS